MYIHIHKYMYIHIYVFQVHQTWIHMEACTNDWSKTEKFNKVHKTQQSHAAGTNARTQTQAASKHRNSNACKQAYIYTYIHIYIYTYIHIYIYIYIHICVCTYIYNMYIQVKWTIQQLNSASKHRGSNRSGNICCRQTWRTTGSETMQQDIQASDQQAQTTLRQDTGRLKLNNMNDCNKLRKTLQQGKGSTWTSKHSQDSQASKFTGRPEMWSRQQ